MLSIRNMMTQTPLFTIATLTPAIFIVLGVAFGGSWVVVALLYLTVVGAGLDHTIDATVKKAETTGNQLSVLLAIVHFFLLPLVLLGLVAPGTSAIEKLGLFFAAGLFFGQISNANAHELIHRPSRGLHRLGMWVYITLLFGHHTSAHVLVHHQHVATAQDPNTSRKGESFYLYALRAWIGSFRMGYRAEAARLARINRSNWQNPYVIYIGGAAMCMGLALILGGAKAALFYLLLAGYAQMQLLLSDYVQHYGLLREQGKNGKAVPVGAQHSWNSPHWFSSQMMLNATRHSDHHAHPARPYPGLTLPDDGPMLPRPLPVMASIALLPPLWRHMMDPLVENVTHA